MTHTFRSRVEMVWEVDDEGKVQSVVLVHSLDSPVPDVDVPDEVTEKAEESAFYFPRLGDLPEGVVFEG